MRRIGPLVQNRVWRQLITLVCLCAFVFVTAAHASHHFAPLVEKAALSMLSAPSDDGDSGEAADSFCLVCTLSAAELTSEDVISRGRVSVRIETAVVELATRPVPAEFPPPIA